METNLRPNDLESVSTFQERTDGNKEEEYVATQDLFSLSECTMDSKISPVEESISSLRDDIKRDMTQSMQKLMSTMMTKMHQFGQANSSDGNTNPYDAGDKADGDKSSSARLVYGN